MLMSPCHYDGYLDPTFMENRISGDGIGTSRCDEFLVFPSLDDHIINICFSIAPELSL
jgi:hypothetical protein